MEHPVTDAANHAARSAGVTTGERYSAHMISVQASVITLLLAVVGVSACTTTQAPAPQPPAPPSVVHPSPPAASEVAPDAPVLVGTVVKVTDGDTIKVQLASGPITVRFGYIDAPEHDQPWGEQATSALARRLTGQRVELEVETQDRYERLVAVVYLGGENMNAWMVKQGHAWAYREYLKEPAYCIWESDARQSRLGLWGASLNSVHAPWEWRRVEEGRPGSFTDYSRETIVTCIAAMHGTSRNVQSHVQSAEPQGACRIKGNISDNGRIYHVPGGKWYDRTEIDPAKGERWFCSEQEALAAGWRAPRN
jgi:endonuclease YncB( thermonuclease family)